jgi:hypothetical protein
MSNDPENLGYTKGDSAKARRREAAARVTTTRCRSCGAECYNAIHEKTRKFSLIDAEPCEDGNVALYLDSIAEIMVYKIVPSSAPFPANHRRYKSHFATCPNAASHRK